MVATNIESSLELLYGISRELATTLDLHTVLTRVLSLSVTNVKAERGSLLAIDSYGELIDAAIFYRDHLVNSALDEMKSTLDQGLAGWVRKNQQSALVLDTRQDERWLVRPDDQADQSGAKSAICTPLMAREQMVGILTIVYPEPDYFTEEHLALLQSIADIAGIAVYNAQLYESLQVAHRRYRDLFEDSINPILLTDWNGNILEVNRQAVTFTGYTENELRRLNIRKLQNCEWPAVIEELKSVHGDETISFESAMITFEHREIPIEIYAREVLIEKESFVQWIFQDITERKALDTMQDDLIAMVYHDLRSPLANIVTSLDMMETMMPVKDDSVLQSIFSITSRSIQRMQRLISSLLDINQLEAGRSITHREALNVETLVDEAAEIVSSVISAKNQNLTVDIPDHLPEVWIDADMIRRVMINLLENATKYTPSQSQITVGGRTESDHVVLWIQDSGPGIPEEAQENIFNKYIRLRGENTPKGIGLGLAFCKLAVEANGGKIWVESEINQGSRFIFTLPKK
jgi:PAS domain S-box-containing protein